MATTCSAQQAAPGSLLEVILTTDLGTQKLFVSNLGLRGALSLRATCRNAASLIDQLLSEPLQLTFENISIHNLDDKNHSRHRSWHDAVTVALRAASKWPHCTSLSLTALARPGDPRISGISSSSNLDFVPEPLLAAATTPGCKPLVHITALRLHVDAAPPRPAAANDAAGAATAAAGDPRAVEVRPDPIVRQRQCDREQHLQLLLWLSHLGRLEQHDGGGALGGASQLRAQSGQMTRSGGGPPWPQPQGLATAAAAAATTAGRFAAMAAAAGVAAATAAAGQPRQAAPRWRCAAPPLDLTHGLLSALARLFPSLECLSLSGHWAAAPSEPAPDHTSGRAGGGGGRTSSTDRGGAGLGPLAALAPLRRLRRLELPAALVLSGGEPGGGGAAAVSGLPVLASVSPSLEELVIRTDCQHQALRQRTQLAWPRALLTAAPQLAGLTLIGGYSRVAGVLLQASHGGPAAAVTAAGPPPPPLRLALVDHLAFLPEPLSVQTLMLEPREGWLLLAAPLAVRSLAACLRLFGAGPAAAAAAPVPAAVVARAAAGAGTAVAREAVAVAPAGAGAGARSAGAREADGAGDGGGLRCVAASCLLLNRAPAEGDWRLLEAFTARPDCVLAVRELSATYPECGGGAAAGREAAGSGLDGGPRGRSNLARALALSATRCERLELRLPGGDLALLAAVVREVGELPQRLLPAGEGSVVVEVMGGPTAAAVEAEELAPATAAVAGAEAEPERSEVDSVLAAALEPYGHLRGLTMPSLASVAEALKISSQYATFNNSALEATIFMPTNEAFVKLTFSLGLGTDPRSLAKYYTSLTKALRYHVVPSAFTLASVVEQSGAQGSTPRHLDTWITTGQYGRLGLSVSPPPPAGGVTTTSDAAAAAITVLGTSSNATVQQTDIVAGASYVNIVDTILQYWYNTLDEALSAMNSTSIFYAALQAANVLPLPYGSTFFVPTDQALAAAGLALPNLAALHPELVRHHLVLRNVSIDIPYPTDTSVALPTLSGQNITLVLPSVNSVRTNGARPSVSSAAVRSSPEAAIVGSLQVGIGANAMIYVIDKVLAPTYTSIWQYLTQQPGFELFTALLQAEGSTLPTLQSSASSLTLLAPNNQAMAALSQRYGGGNLSNALDKAALRDLVRNHIVPKPMSYAALSRNSTLDTLTATAALRTSMAGGVVSVSAVGSTANILTPNNISILYGRAYIYVVDYVLLSSPQGGAAAAAAPPSLLLLLLSGVLAARLAARLAAVR
ncbi:hypothetical protein PLESTM_001947600 [Pleodorina starrii]|nr:hypothetical protein PLESTM_001947600 [Pleodorina starrii]